MRKEGRMELAASLECWSGSKCLAQTCVHTHTHSLSHSTSSSRFHFHKAPKVTCVPEFP